MSAKLYNVLFLCTGNTARSVLAESILNHEGAGKFVAYTAGSHPKGIVHPQTIRLLKNLGYETSVYRSKIGMNSPQKLPPKWISFLQFATMLRAKLALFG